MQQKIVSRPNVYMYIWHVGCYMKNHRKEKELSGFSYTIFFLQATPFFISFSNN